MKRYLFVDEDIMASLQQSQYEDKTAARKLVLENDSNPKSLNQLKTFSHELE